MIKKDTLKISILLTLYITASIDALAVGLSLPPDSLENVTEDA